jgi:hypothetical protein
MVGLRAAGGDQDRGAFLLRCRHNELQLAQFVTAGADSSQVVTLEQKIDAELFGKTRCPIERRRPAQQTDTRHRSNQICDLLVHAGSSLS